MNIFTTNLPQSGKIALVLDSYDKCYQVRMAEWSKALRSGRSPLLWAWVRIPLLTQNSFFPTNKHEFMNFKIYQEIYK